MNETFTLYIGPQNNYLEKYDAFFLNMEYFIINIVQTHTFLYLKYLHIKIIMLLSVKKEQNEEQN